MVNWYRHDIPAWMDGTESLSDRAYRAFHVICQLIYLNEGPIVLNERGIAGRCNQDVRRFRASFKELVDAGKLRIVDGKITNGRADDEIGKIFENRINAGKGGRSKGHKGGIEGTSKGDREGIVGGSTVDSGGIVDTSTGNHQNNPLKNNDPPQASLLDDASLKEKRKEEKKESPLNPPKGKRLPEDWKPSEADRNYARSKGLSESQVDTEAEKFKNYWLTKPGAGGVKLDWSRTWQNWVMTAAERLPKSTAAAAQDDDFELMRRL